MGTGHLGSTPKESDEDMMRRIAREEFDKKLDELATEALEHLKALG